MYFQGKNRISKGKSESRAGKIKQINWSMKPLNKCQVNKNNKQNISENIK